MARFFAEIVGNRGIASRVGTERSGMWAHVRGWNVGVEVQCLDVGGVDVIRVYKTGGSSAARNSILLAELREEKTP